MIIDCQVHAYEANPPFPRDQPASTASRHGRRQVRPTLARSAPFVPAEAHAPSLWKPDVRLTPARLSSDTASP